MNNTEDFICDTLLHVAEVQENLELISSELRRRGHAHDRSKFQEPEFTHFVSTRQKFKLANYGTKEYEECVELAKPAVDHHHKTNSHHVQFHENGISAMSLIDILEMLADWKAAERRSPDKNLIDSLELSFEKAGICPQLRSIISNTLNHLKWI